MIKISGEYGKAKVMTTHIEKNEDCPNQRTLRSTIDKKDTNSSHTRLSHRKGCVIGLRMRIKETVVSNLVGVDSGCDMKVIKVANKELNYKKLDKVITNKIPAGREVRKKVHPYFEKLNLKELRCWHAIAQHQD